MIRVRVSLLEAFRRCVETEYGDEASVIRTVTGNPDPPNWRMRAGTAFHALLARPRAEMCAKKRERGNYYLLQSAAEAEAARLTGRSGETIGAFRCMECGCWHVGKQLFVHAGGYHFDDHAVDEARRHVGPGLCEVKALRTWQVGPHAVNVVAQADHVRGLALIEHKTKFSPPDPKDYEASLQWRFYLQVHGAAVLRYCLWHFADPKDGYCELRDVVSFRVWPYAGLEADCRAWLTRFVEWAESRQLLGYLDRESMAPAFEEAA